MMRRFLLPAALLLLSHAPAAAQATGTLTVRVTAMATGRELPGATVELPGPGRSAVTGPRGSVRFDSLAPGFYRVRVRAIGYAPYTRADVAVSSGKAAEVAIPLQARAIELAPITIAPYFQPDPGSPTGSAALSGEEVRGAPGVQEDVVRAVALLPGVAITTAARNDLVVRGGAPFENLFLVDNLEVPNINHFGSQGSTGGPLSLINVDFVRDARFSAGGFGVAHGNRTASLTDITLRDGAGDRISGELNLAATGFGAMAEGPIDGRTSFLAGLRRSYLDLLFQAAGFSFVPSYWDLQLKLTRRLDPGSTLSFLFIGAIDNVRFNNADAEDRYDNSRILSPEQRQYFSALTWRRAIGTGQVSVTLGRTWTRFRTLQRDSLNPPQTVFQSFSTEGENSLRVDVALGLGLGSTLRIGNVVKVASDLRYEVTLPGSLRLDQFGAPRPLAVDTTFTAWRNGTYAEVSTPLGQRLQLTAGLRGDYYDYLGRSFRLAPRSALSLALDDRTRLTLGGGRYYQSPSFIWLVGDTANPARLRPFRVDQVTAGFERLLRPDLRLQIETYYKRYADYPARVFRPQAVLSPSGFEDATTDIPFGLEPLVSQGTGRGYGVEALVQKRPGETPLFGLLSLSLGRVEFSGLDRGSRPGAFDTRVIGTLLAGYRFGRQWEVSGKFRIATGLPTTPFVTAGPEAGQLDFARYNAGPRLPTFHALDARVDRRWSFRGVQLVTYLDVQNLYGRANVSRYTWNQRTGRVEADESLGVLPSIGVNVEF